MTGLVWFRHDYRVMNHTPLLLARKEHNSVAAVIFDCPKQWEQFHYSQRRQNVRAQAIRALNSQLKQLNIPLIYIERDTFRDIPLELLKICRKLDIQHLYFNREYSYRERKRDEDVKIFLRDHDIGITIKDDAVIVPPEMTMDENNEVIESFEHYKTIWKSYAQGVELRQTPPACEEMADCKNLERFPDQADIVNMESKAHRLLHQHVTESLALNQKKQNRALLSSGLSTYITLGILSPAQCLTLANQTSSEKSEQWMNGIIKRCFFRYIMFNHTKLRRHFPFIAKAEQLPWRHDKALFKAWRQGKTGFPLVDAAMNELNKTGWISYPMREVVAMFLCKNLLIDWRWGERYFMEKLIDGDIASNNGGWQWCASTGAIASPYFRLIDPAQETKKLDPDGQYIKKWVPELRLLTSKEIVQSNANALSKVKGYPKPIVDPVQSRCKSLEFFSFLK